ncbi:Fusaric acid resistance protein-like [Devosia sp. YR412]|uniref:FUSC family protein n=1 Tax=Devosia sp. YR412 TaxID=1881030 RepID=UPI0008C3A824|nr:FUSC family protein [Devosia sp. YR412]SEP72584.1 Fusaric acid resistance protein-like [Devosia sp. YR412]
MEQLTRVDLAEDPHFALRTALGLGLAVLLAEPLGISVPVLVVSLTLSLMSSQRGRFSLRRGMVVPLAIPVISAIFSAIAAMTLGEPLLFTTIFLIFAAIGLYLMVIRGSIAGSLFAIIPAMISVTAVASDQALVVMRDSFTMTGLFMAVTLPLLNFLLPPKTDRVHVPAPVAADYDRPGREVLLRLAILAPVLLFCWITADANLVILPIIVIFVLGQGEHTMRHREAFDRIIATLLGAATAIAGLAVYHLIPALPVFIGLTMLVGLYAAHGMSKGRLSPVTYQFGASVALILMVTSIGTRDAFEIIFQRTALTVVGAVLAIGALALLEEMVIGAPARLRQRRAARVTARRLVLVHSGESMRAP